MERRADFATSRSLNKVFWATLHGLISLRNEGLISHEDAMQQIMSDIEIVLTNGFLNGTAASDCKPQ